VSTKLNILVFSLYDTNPSNVRWIMPNNFYPAANAVFGKIVRVASEEVTLQIILCKCLPVLLYGLESCPLNASDTRSINFVINFVLMKLFKTSGIESVKYCQMIFKFQLPSMRLNRQESKFMIN